MNNEHITCRDVLLHVCFYLGMESNRTRHVIANASSKIPLSEIHTLKCVKKKRVEHRVTTKSRHDVKAKTVRRVLVECLYSFMSGDVQLHVSTGAEASPASPLHLETSYFTNTIFFTLSKSPALIL